MKEMVPVAGLWYLPQDPRPFTANFTVNNDIILKGIVFGFLPDCIAVCSRTLLLLIFRQSFVL